MVSLDLVIKTRKGSSFGDWCFESIMATQTEEELRGALASILLKDGNDDEGVIDGIDGDIVDYLAGMLYESGLDDVEESIGPFLEGYGCEGALIKACGDAVMQCGGGAADYGGSNNIHKVTVVANGNKDDDDPLQQAGAVKLKQGIVSMSSALTDQSEAEMDANRYMWGQDK